MRSVAAKKKAVVEVFRARVLPGQPSVRSRPWRLPLPFSSSSLSQHQSRHGSIGPCSFRLLDLLACPFLPTCQFRARSMATSPPAPSAVEPQPSSLAPDLSPFGEDSTHGFSRAEMFSQSLVGTVQHYERHLFLCYKDPQSWPPQAEGPAADPLPRLLASTLKSRKNDMHKKTRFTVCEGLNGEDLLKGDVLIFPDMLRYKQLSEDDIEPFVDEFLVNGREFTSERTEKLDGAHIFVCAHAKRDMRCGVCGPALIERFKSEIALRDLDDRVSVRCCSHVGGHKYAGNVIIYSPNASGELAGHWYGYVTPEDVASILDDHIGKFKIIERLWRGEMGLIEADQKEAQKQRCETNDAPDHGNDVKENCCCIQAQGETNGYFEEKGSATSRGCCQKKAGADHNTDKGGNAKAGQGYFCCTSSLASYFDSWKRGDTLAALTVVGAVAAVVYAFHLRRKSL